MKKIYLTLIALFSIINLQLTIAQTLPTYQWGAQGCGNHSTQNTQRQLMCVSKNGTVFAALSSSDMNDKIMAGVSSPNRFSGGRISAHDTRGNLKWTKFLGGYGTTGNISYMASDNDNNLIIIASLSSVDSSLFGLGELKPAPYIHPDTILPYERNNSQNRSNFICKFNNNGQLIWFKWIEKNFGNSLYKRKLDIYDLSFDEQNNIMMHATLDVDTFFNGQLITTNRVHFTRITLDPQGNFVNHQPYDIHIGDRYNWTITPSLLKIGIPLYIETDVVRRKIYMSVTAVNNGDTFRFGNHRFEFNNLQEPRALWMQFDWNGQLDWLSTCKGFQTTNMVKDELGYFYTGLYGIDNNIPMFNGNIPIDSHKYKMSIIRFDSLGQNPKHLQSAYNTATGGLYHKANLIYQNNTVSYSAYFSLDHLSNNSRSTYIDRDTSFVKDYERNVSSPGVIQIDADNGKLVYFKTIKRSTNSHETTTSSPVSIICKDDKSNLVVAGMMSADSFYFDQNNIPNHSNSMPKEGYWAKLAYNNMDCNLPDPSFSFRPQSFNGLELTYTGGSSNLSEQKWSFGDGSKAYNQDVVNYQYQNPGTYRVCLNVQNDCGPKAICQFVTVSEDGVGIPHVSTNNTALFPNPSKGNITVEATVAIKTITVYDILGKHISQQQLKPNSYTTQVDLAEVPTGTYMVQITDHNNQTYVHKIVIDK